MASDDKPSKGDHVSSSSHGNKVEGTVEQKITSRTETAGRTMDASKDDPQYKVKSDKTAGELEKWLKTEESREVGQKKADGAESVGHDSGRKIVKLLHTKKDELTSQDEDHMRKVTGYVHRHLAQRPSGDIGESKWRYSLMNWGHDPLKK